MKAWNDRSWLSRFEISRQDGKKTHAKTQRRKGLKKEYEKFSACWRLEVSFVRRRPFHRKAAGHKPLKIDP